jgi:predicted ATPase
VNRSQHLPTREGKYDSLVDLKLSQVLDNLVRYFSLLFSRGAARSQKFQKEVFQSLPHHTTQTDAIANLMALDLDEELKSLKQIFHEFSVDDNETLESISKQFNFAKQAQTKDFSKQGFTWDELSATLGMLRSHSIVQEWKLLVNELQKINEPRVQFLTMLLTLMPKKTFSVNQENELSAKIGNNSLPLFNLSSGEKQLLIILGEALLQDKVPCIYIADEPELSLHVTWQEQLIPNLRLVNPNAQIIFATHSPDIVGQYSKNIMDMEKIIG